MENDENKEVITVENEGGKGNPNHKPAGSPDGGQFTSKEEAGNVDKAPQKGEDYIGVFELKEEKPVSSLKQAMLEFSGRKKAVLSQEARDYVDSISENFSEEQHNFYKKLSREEKIELLQYNKAAGYDPIRLKFATDDQLTALLYAEGIQNMPKKLQQEKILLENAKKELEDKMAEELNTHDTEQVFNVWKYASPTLKDYAQLKASGSLEKKKEYYKGVLENPESPLVEKAKATQKLAALKKFEEAGEEYEKLKMDLMVKNVDEMEAIETKIAEINTKLGKFYTSDGQKTEFLQKADEYCDKFKDKNSAYSKFRKDNATWFNLGSAQENTDAAIKHFGPRADKHWESMTIDERASLKDYTGSPSKFNEPLRKIKYVGSKSFESGLGYGSKAKQMAKGITDMTNAIDKCTWDEDIWVQRGVSSSTKMFGLNGVARSIESMTPEEMQKMVGTSFTDNGFYSAGAGKHTGFSSSGLIINTYCPKGTKMAYMNTKGYYAHSHENEMILQRGYTYRITKVEYNSNVHKYFIDCEVVLGSDDGKPVGKDLEAIGAKFYA